MAFLRAEIFNGALAIVKSWGGAASVNAKTPAECNPIEANSSGERQVDAGTASAFAYAEEHERVRRGE